jgi:hypothetical protein
MMWQSPDSESYLVVEVPSLIVPNKQLNRAVVQGSIDMIPAVKFSRREFSPRGEDAQATGELSASNPLHDYY